jgi:hypothetical protein
VEYKFLRYSFHDDIKKLQHYYQKNIDSFTAQKIADRLWQAYEKLIFGNGKAIHFIKFGDFNSVEGKSNGTGIMYRDGYLVWNGLTIPVVLNSKNAYETEALEKPIAYCRIIRKFVRGRYKFYVQIVFKSTDKELDTVSNTLVKVSV